MDGSATEPVKLVAEITLVLILFHDAAQVRPREIGSDGGFYARLLLIGFPLTILLGYLVARLLFPDLPVMMALLLAAALAPTDAGLGAPTVLNPVVPTRIRRALNVESGLNDGLATPVVLFAIAVLAGEEGLGPRETIGSALVEVVLGVVAGVAVGAAGGALLGWSRQHRMSTAASRTLGVLMIPLLAYGAALVMSGNGFVAAFISGTAFAGSAAWIHEEESALLGAEELSDLLGYAVWLVLGLVAVPLVWREAGWREPVFALVALTVVRMLPVAAEPDRHPPATSDGRVHRVVRPPRAGLGGVLADRAGVPGRRRRPARRAGHHLPDGPAERDRPRVLRPAAGRQVRGSGSPASPHLRSWPRWIGASSRGHVVPGCGADPAEPSVLVGDDIPAERRLGDRDLGLGHEVVGVVGGAAHLDCVHQDHREVGQQDPGRDGDPAPEAGHHDGHDDGHHAHPHEEAGTGARGGPGPPRDRAAPM